jgi:heterodisulfide reductase subunit C
MSKDKEFLKEVERRSGQDLQACYQCGKCSAGCPVSPYKDFKPNQIIRMIQYGQRDKVLKSHAIWLCVSCMTCGVRCPNDIDIAAIMDTLREMAVEAGYSYRSEKNVVLLHEEFVRSIRIWGRVHEATMLGLYKLRSMDFFTDLVPGVKLMLKMKIPFIPTLIKGAGEVRKMFKKTYDKKE